MSEITCERYLGEADEYRRLQAECVAAALDALAILRSEGESDAFIEADIASEQAAQKLIRADHATRSPDRTLLEHYYASL